MRRKVSAALLAIALSALVVTTQPAAAQGHGCKAFGQNVAGLARSLGPGFGQTASSNAPLNDTVAAEQAAFCGG